MKWLILLGLLYSVNINLSETKKYEVHGLLPVYKSKDTTLYKVWYIGTNVDIVEAEDTVKEFCGKGLSFPKCEVVDYE